MKFNYSFVAIIFSVFIYILAPNIVFSGSIGIPETDTGDRQQVGFFDLRERETFIQITNTDTNPAGRIIHIQIFNVADNCNENNFNDFYTPVDTHVYNLRDIKTNDGNPSGVVLPPDAYGIIVATYVSSNGSPPSAMIGNLRIEDNNGYEYRTNLQGPVRDEFAQNRIFTFNFNTLGGVTLTDVVGISLDNIEDFSPPAEVFAADVVNIWRSVDVDILNNNEVTFSCRNVIFSCVDQDNPLLEALLEDSGDANVASFEYGINNALPHSKGGELLCPGNTISEGFVRLSNIGQGSDTDNIFFMFIGLNNGNGRGSLDAMWNQSSEFSLPD